MNRFWTYLTNLMESIAAFFTSIPFTGATWIVLAILLFFVWIFAKANKKSDSPIHWEHLIIDSNNDRTSPYKVGYIIGLVVGTWIVISLTDHDTLDTDTFGVYLMYLLGGAGVNSFVKRGSRNDRYDSYDSYDEYDSYDNDYRSRRRKPSSNRHPQTQEEPHQPPEYGPSVQNIDVEP